MAARLKALFPEPDFYLDEGAMREAIVNRSMFNLLETREGDDSHETPPGRRHGGKQERKQFNDALRVWEVPTRSAG